MPAGMYASNELYEIAIASIDNWLDSIPENQYQKATEDEIFRWKVMIEKNQGLGLFLTYYELLGEINQKEFIYENKIFNQKTIRYYQLFKYPDYFLSQADFSKIKVKPEKLLKTSYDYYRKNINKKEEQLAWLKQFMSFLSYYKHLINHKFYIEKINETNYDIVANILNQYIIISKYYLTKESINIPLIFLYTYNKNKPFITIGLGNNENSILEVLYHFSDTWKEYLKSEDKKTILNFVLPKYQDSDYAVKIYSVLSD